jgi:catechol 2,3-dioxygenase-like lactoylglutathione lyase family enzyme
MFTYTKAFSSFSVHDVGKSKQFYSDVLGMRVIERPEGLKLALAGGEPVFVYPKENHEPATFTVLNFVVDDIDQAINGLVSKGVVMEHYDMPGMEMDAKGVVRNTGAEAGPKAIAWFKDPAENIFSVIQEK